MSTSEGAEIDSPLQPISRTEDEVRLLVDETVYSREAVLRACYWFTDRAYLFVSRSGPERLLVSIRAKAGGAYVDTMAGDFARSGANRCEGVRGGEPLGRPAGRRRPRSC